MHTISFSFKNQIQKLSVGISILSADITCNSYPCKNGGTCLNLETGGVHCQCPVGHEGDTCEEGRYEYYLVIIIIIITNNHRFLNFRYMSLFIFSESWELSKC